MILPEPNSSRMWGAACARVIISPGTSVSTRDLVQELDRYQYVYLVSYDRLDLDGYDELRKKTILLDLAKDEEEIYGGFRKNTRNEIRKTYKIDGLEFLCPDRDVARTYEIYKEVKEAEGVMLNLKREFYGLLAFNAYYEGETIASIVCLANGGVLRFRHIVSKRKKTKDYGKLSGYASRRLVWEICKYGKENAYKYVDVGIVNMLDPRKSGIAYFKQCFGGELTDTYVYRKEGAYIKLLKAVYDRCGRELVEAFQNPYEESEVNQQ